MGLYNERGNMRVTVDDTSMPFGIYAADGSVRVTVVDGSTFTGLYDTDGGFNVVTVDATDTPVSIYHPCGALRGVSASSETGLSAPNGAIYMDGLQSTITAPVLDWDDETADTTPDFTCTLVDPVVGDTLTLQLYSDAGLTTLVDSDVNVLDAGEVTAEECTFSLAALSDGTYYARVFAERTGWSSSYSNTVTVTIASSFDPLTITGLKAWYDPGDLSTMFQDTAGTTPVTATGQTVKRINDKSGNGLHQTNSTGWLLQNDGTHNYLDTDASSYFQASSVVWGSDKVFAAIRGRTDAAATGQIVWFGAVTVETGTFWIQINGSSLIEVIRYGSSGGFGYRTTTNNFSTVKVLTTNIDLSGTTHATENPDVRFNGVQETLSDAGTANTGSGNFGTYSLRLGGGSNAMNGRIYEIILATANQTGTTLTDIETYMAG